MSLTILIQLRAIARIAFIEALAVARAAAVIGEFQLPTRLIGVTRGFTGASRVVVGAAHFAFTVVAHDESTWLGV